MPPPTQPLHRWGMRSEAVPLNYAESYACYESGNPMPIVSRVDAELLKTNYEQAPTEYKAACLALPAFVDHMGLEFSCGYLRDQLVRKDRRTSDFSGKSKKANDLRTKLNGRLLSFQDKHPPLAVQLSQQ